MRRLACWLLVAGILLIAPSAYVLLAPQITEDDVQVAFTPATRIPLDQLTKACSVTVSFTVPSSRQWARIRKEWGDPGYIVLGVLRRRADWVHPYDALNVDVRVTRASVAVETKKAETPPYGYSCDTRNVGMTFRANPGDELTIEISGRSQGLTGGELRVQPNWGGAAKDHIVGAMINEDLHRYTRISMLVGIAFTVAGTIACLATRPRSA